MANSRLRFLMPRRAPGPGQQSSDLSAAPERSMDPETLDEPALTVPSLVTVHSRGGAGQPAR